MTAPPVSRSGQSRFDDSSEDDTFSVNVHIPRSPPAKTVDLKDYADSAQKRPVPSRRRQILCCRWVLPMLCAAGLAAGAALGVLGYLAITSAPGYSLCEVSLCGGLDLEDCAEMLQSTAGEGQEIEADLTLLLENPTAFHAVLSEMSSTLAVGGSNQSMLSCHLVDSEVHLPAKSWAPLSVHCSAMWNDISAAFLHRLLMGNGDQETLHLEYSLRVLGITVSQSVDLPMALTNETSDANGPSCPAGMSASNLDVLGSRPPALSICESRLSAGTQDSLDSCLEAFGFVGSLVNKILPGSPVSGGACEEVLNTVEITIRVLLENPTAFPVQIQSLSLHLTRSSDGFGLGEGFIEEPMVIVPHGITSVDVLFDLSGARHYDVSGATLQMLTDAATNQLSVQLQGAVVVSVLGATFPSTQIPPIEVFIPTANPLAGSTGSQGCTQVPLSLTTLM